MNPADPEPIANVSLLRWLSRPASWSGPEKLAMLVLVCMGAAVLAAGVNPILTDLLAMAAYGALALLVLLLVWRRFFES